MITKEDFLNHWAGHRHLTKKTIEAFPEKELFHFSIGGMRTFAEIVTELIVLSSDGLNQLATGRVTDFDESLKAHSKQDLLEAWEKSSEGIAAYLAGISEEQLHKPVKLFGMYEFSTLNHLLYFTDNEIHHRAQGYVYLRALGLEPPAFWDRGEA